MGRSLQHRVVAIALLLVLLLPLPPPALSAPTFVGEMFVAIEEIGKKAFKQCLEEEGKNVLKIGVEFIVAKIKKARGRGRHGHHEKEEEEAEKSADSATGLFIVNLTVGTPSPQTISGILDINSQLVWTQCTPCISDSEHEHDCLVGPTSHLFQPNRSGTFSILPCRSDICKRNVPGEACGRGGGTGHNRNHSGDDDDRCIYVDDHGNDTFTIGHLANDTFTFGTTRVDNIVFGCSAAAVGNFSGTATGVIGFNRGPLSLVTQLQLSWFSYLWSLNESESQFRFGGDRAPQPQNFSSSTRLLTSRDNPDMYFVRLTGIRVDGEDLAGAIPAGTFDFEPYGSGGVLLNTTVPVTFLDEDAYCAVKGAIAARIAAVAGARTVDGSPAGLDLCYEAASLKTVKVPKLALVFDGGAVMNLSRYNYFYNDSDSGLDCLSILPSVGGSVLGSLAQKGTSMTYDIAT